MLILDCELTPYTRTWPTSQLQDWVWQILEQEPTYTFDVVTFFILFQGLYILTDRDYRCQITVSYGDNYLIGLYMYIIIVPLNIILPL